MEITLDIEILPAVHPTALEFEARLFGEHIGFFETYQRACQAALNLAALRKGGAEKEQAFEQDARRSWADTARRQLFNGGMNETN